LHEGSSTGSIAETLKFAKKYLYIMLIGLFPFAIEQSYSGTLRETGETVVPMKAGIVAVFVNLIFNYLLIYGKFGIPVMGVQGAAIATVISRFVECTIIVLWTHKNSKRNLFIQGVYRNFRIPVVLCQKIIIKGMPLLINEFFWSSGMAIITQCYSVKGLAVVAGLNISTTITNLFSIFTFAMGNTVSIIVGQKLGAGDFKDAKDTAEKIIFMSIIGSVIVGLIMILLAPLFPLIYNTSDEVKTLAKSFIQIFGLAMPIQAYTNATYFTLRSGGKTFITFLFDSVYVWVIAIPTAFMLISYTSFTILTIYFICQFIDIIKCSVGFIMLKKGVWLHNIVNQ
jgi:putative MATE family efflux protein